MKTIKNLIIKYKELIIYVLFGLCNTVVNLGAYKLLTMLLGVELYLVSNGIAWFVTVVFAFITNKLFVFQSKSWKMNLVFKEAVSFFATRVLSFFIEEAGLFALVDLAGLKNFSLDVSGFSIGGDMIAKLTIAVVVVIWNYVFSKFVIFRKKDK